MIDGMAAAWEESALVASLQDEGWVTKEVLKKF